MLSGRGLCVGLSLVQASATECDHEASVMRPWPINDCYATGEKFLVFGIGI